MEKIGLQQDGIVLGAVNEAIQRIGVLIPVGSGLSYPRWSPIQSDDSADFVAAVQNLAAFCALRLKGEFNGR